MLVMHGTQDMTFGHAAAEQLAETWRARDSCEGAPVTEPIAIAATISTSSDCAAATAVSFISVQNGHHSWFREPDATRIAWQFFLDHGRE